MIVLALARRSGHSALVPAMVVELSASRRTSSCGRPLGVAAAAVGAVDPGDHPPVGPSPYNFLTSIWVGARVHFTVADVVTVDSLLGAAVVYLPYSLASDDRDGFGAMFGGTS